MPRPHLISLKIVLRATRESIWATVSSETQLAFQCGRREVTLDM